MNHPGDPVLSISRSDLPPRVTSYLDNLATQITSILTKHGVTTTPEFQGLIAQKKLHHAHPDVAQMLALLEHYRIAAQTKELPPDAPRPYEVWKQELDPLLTQHLQSEAGKHLRESWDLTDQEISSSPIEALIQKQESWYQEQYEDPEFRIDRHHPCFSFSPERVQDIRSAIERGEVNFPLLTALPRTLTPEELSDPSLPHPETGLPQPQTLHRVLMNWLIRGNEISIWERTDPSLNEFLEQARDLTPEDFTRADLQDPKTGKPLLDTEGDPIAFDKNHWLPYLQALYRAIPRPDATSGYLSLSFVAWEQDPPGDRNIPTVESFSSEGAPVPRRPGGGGETISNKSQLDAVRLQYPLLTPSQYLSLFAQYHARTGQPLDDTTWSWLFGIIDPEKFPDHPSVIADWSSGGLSLRRDGPGSGYSGGRLRVGR